LTTDLRGCVETREDVEPVRLPVAGRGDDRPAVFFAVDFLVPAPAPDFFLAADFVATTFSAVAFLGAALRGAAFLAPAFFAGEAPERAELLPDALERRAVDLVAMGDSLVGNRHSYLICNTRIRGVLRS
jgi:hypothetical protein